VLVFSIKNVNTNTVFCVKLWLKNKVSKKLHTKNRVLESLKIQAKRLFTQKHTQSKQKEKEKMKRKLKGGLLAIALAVIMLFLAACPVDIPPQPNPIESVTFVTASLPPDWEHDSEFSLAGIQVRVEFNDGRENNVIVLNHDDERLTFAPAVINTSVAGRHELRVTFTEGDFSRDAITIMTVLPAPVVNPVLSIAFVDFDFEFEQYQTLPANLFHGTQINVVFRDDARDDQLISYPHAGLVFTHSINTNIAGAHIVTATFTYQGFATTAAGAVTVTTDNTNPIDRIEFVDPPTSFVLGSTLDFAGTEITIYYVDGEYRTITFPYSGAGTLTLTGVDINAVGSQILVATFVYEGFTNSTIALVNVVREWAITSFTLPGFLVTYNSNISRYSAGATDYFLIENAGYYIGTNNPFIFFPSITEVDVDTMTLRPITVESGFSPLVHVYNYRVVNETPAGQDNEYDWVRLEGEELGNDGYVTVIPSIGSFQFHDKAIGAGSFRITQEIENPEHLFAPENLPNMPPIVLDNITIVDALNVTEVGGTEGLAMLDNRYQLHSPITRYEPDPWESVRPEQDNDLRGIVLHRNINLNRETLPDTFFDNDGFIRQFSTAFAFFFRIHDDSTTPFNFIGNYFSINSNELPLVDTSQLHPFAPDLHLSHSSLFFFVGNTELDYDGAEPERSTISIRNFSSLGNVIRSGNAIDSRGTRFAVTRGNVHVSNAILRGHLMHFQVYANDHPDLPHGNGVLRIEDIRASEAWSNFIFSWNGEVEVHRSHARNFGGPAVILDNHWGHIPGFHNDGNTTLDPGHRTEIYPIVRFYNMYALESLVRGTEPWFVQNGVAPIMTDIFDLNNVIERDIQKTIFQEVVINDGFNIETIEALNIVGAIINNAAGGFDNNFFDDTVSRGVLTIDGVDILNNEQHIVTEFLGIAGTLMPPLANAWNGLMPDPLPVFSAAGHRFLPGEIAGLLVYLYMTGQAPNFGFNLTDIPLVNLTFPAPPTPLTPMNATQRAEIQAASHIGTYLNTGGMLGTVGIAFSLHNIPTP